jgi:hypothetical protein
LIIIIALTEYIQELNKDLRIYEDDNDEIEILTPFQALCIEYVKWFAQAIPFESNDTKEMLCVIQDIAFLKDHHMSLELSTRLI